MFCDNLVSCIYYLNLSNHNFTKTIFHLDYYTMKTETNITDQIPFTENDIKLIEGSIRNYRRFAKVKIAITDVVEKTIHVIAHQYELVNDKILTSEELIQRGKGVFEGLLPKDYSVFIKPITYQLPIENEVIDTNYLQTQMSKYALESKDMAVFLNIDPSTISLLRSGEKPLTKWHKTTMVYFFKYLNEVSKYQMTDS